MKLGSEVDETSRLRTDEPFARSGMANDVGSSRLSFAFSLSQLMQAQANEEASKASAGMMGLGARASNRYTPPPVAAPGLDVWIEGHFVRFDDNLGQADRSGNFSVLYVGADYLVKPGLLVGFLAQFDQMNDRSTKLNTNADGNGWLVGPYVGIQLSKNLLFDARAAWGQSNNQVNPIGLYTDSFSTDRMLARASLTGNWYSGRWRFSPSMNLIHVEETQNGYTDTLGIFIPSQRVALSRFTFGPEIGYQIPIGMGSTMEPHVSLMGIWDFDKDAVESVGGLLVGTTDFRGRVEGGLIFRDVKGPSVRASLSYDGIGDPNFRAVGTQLWINVPLN